MYLSYSIDFDFELALILRKIIERVRKSVRAIADLDSPHQAQGKHLFRNIRPSLLTTVPVIQAYQSALQWTFISAIASFVVVNLLVAPIKLPRLGYDKVAADIEDDN